MEEYIPKSALLAEIKKHLEYANNGILYAQTGIEKGLKKYERDLNAWQHCQSMCKNILSFIDTIEVKEVDLEKESLTWEDIPTILTISEQLKTGWWFVDRTKDIGTQAFWEEVLKRFKAQKEEEK